jgi:long-chain fatty acid transport protein
LRAISYTAEAEPYVHIVSAALTYRWDNPTETVPVRPVVRKY